VTQMQLVGYVRVKGVVANPLRRDIKVEVEFIADTGAIYTVIPRSIAEKLGLETVDKRKSKVASGDIVEYPAAEAYIAVEGRGVTSLVVVGPENVTPLLGVTTLELLGYQADHITGKLKPAELLLL